MGTKKKIRKATGLLLILMTVVALGFYCHSIGTLDGFFFALGLTAVVVLFCLVVTWLLTD